MVLEDPGGEPLDGLLGPPMELGIFLRITPFQAELALSEEEVFRGAEKSLRKYFGKRGERVVRDNLEAVRRGYHEAIEVPPAVMLSTEAADKANAALRVMQAEGGNL